MGWIAAFAEGRIAGGAEVKGGVVFLSGVTAHELLADDLQTHGLLKGRSKRNHRTNVKNKLLLLWEDSPK